jgi:hypothetical protein
MEAAIAGQGIAIGTIPLINDDLRDRRLVLAHPCVTARPETHHFACAPEMSGEYCIDAFRAWLLKEGRLDSRGLPLQPPNEVPASASA